MQYLFWQQTMSIAIDDEALHLIATRGDGSFRDSISLLDQLRSLTDDKTTITRDLIEQTLGLAPATLIENVLDAYDAKDLKKIISLIDDSEKAGIQSTVITPQLIDTVRVRLAEKPQYIQLLDQLLDVPKSSQPSIKLLTVLAAYAAPKPKSAALVAPLPEVSAPIAELEKQATKAKPAMSAPKPQPAPVKAAAPQPAPATPQPAAISSPAPSHTPQKPTGQPIDWNELIEYTRANYVAIYSVLKKCNYEHNGDTLLLYTGTAFWKKKLDDTRHRLNLVDALEKIGFGALVIETVGTPPPPKDSTAAAVAAIMGGGEEVHVGE